jgi:hypothetical protein
MEIENRVYNQVVALEPETFFQLFKVEECVIQRSDQAFHNYQPTYINEDGLVVYTECTWDRVKQWLKVIIYGRDNLYDEHDWYDRDGCRRNGSHNGCL